MFRQLLRPHGPLSHLLLKEWLEALVFGYVLRDAIVHAVFIALVDLLIEVCELFPLPVFVLIPGSPEGVVEHRAVLTQLIALPETIHSRFRVAHVGVTATSTLSVLLFDKHFVHHPDRKY